MDPRQLKVGQIIILRSGSYGCEAKVLKITPAGNIIVEEINYPGKPFRLNRRGVAVNSSDLGWNEGRIYNESVPIPGTFENGPWEIDHADEPVLSVYLRRIREWAEDLVAPFTWKSTK